MTIYIDPLTGFYLGGTLIVLILVLTAFIAAWTEHQDSKSGRKTTTTS